MSVLDVPENTGNPYPYSSLLSPARKIQIVEQVQSSALPSSQVADINNIKHSTIRKYIRYVSSGKPFYEKVGRPSLIDEISANDILTNLQLQSDRILKVYFAGLLTQERSSTYRRRFNKDINFNRPLSKVTIDKYYHHFMAMLSILRGRQVGYPRRNRPRHDTLDGVRVRRIRCNRSIPQTAVSSPSLSPIDDIQPRYLNLENESMVALPMPSYFENERLNLQSESALDSDAISGQVTATDALRGTHEASDSVGELLPVDGIDILPIRSNFEFESANLNLFLNDIRKTTSCIQM